MNKAVVTALLGLVTGFFLGTLGKGKRRSVLDDIPASILPPTTVVPTSNIKVVLDFDLVAGVYERYGKEGVYAYLVDNNLAKDYQHGSFIIDQIFVPEYEKFKRRQGASDEPITEQPQT
jgi:hypothetical protein